MKKSFALFLYALLVPAVFFKLNAQTSVPGGLAYGHWTLSGSPYNIMGSVQIPQDSTLIIDPGVTVNFQGTYKMAVQGRLLAIGTVTDTIFFTASNTSTGWRGIKFSSTPLSNDTSKIMYCSLRNGKATGPSPDDQGGAIYINTYSKVIVSHCRITDNMANSTGGGIYIYQGDPLVSYNNISNNSSSNSWGGGLMLSGTCNAKILNNTISYNTVPAGDYGGAIACSGNGCTPLINGNSITHNTAGQGGGIYITALGCAPTITNNDISHNTATSAGGGITCYFNVGSACVISNNTISYNTGNSQGGGMWCSQSASPTLSYNIFSNNNLLSSPGWGGGICAQNTSNPKISNCVISNNTGMLGGGLYASAAASITVNNTTIANNVGTSGGALYCTSNSDVLFRNSILYGNTATSAGPQVYLFDDNSDPLFYYSDIEGGSAAFDLNGGIYIGTYQNNINSNPNFVSPSAGTGIAFNGVSADWSLQNGSPCIDTGDPSYSPYPATDLANNPRVTVCRADMGAYEYQNGIPFVVSTSHTDVTCFNACNGTATANATGGSGSYTYTWLPGNQSSQSVTGLCNGTYTVQVNETGGCSTSVSLTITQPSAGSTSTVSICMATVDSLSQNNVIFWDKTSVPLADTFLIYRDTANNNYALIGKVPFDSLSQFIDTVRTLYLANGDPNVSSWRYKIAVYDTCGNIGAMSPYHQTMFFQNNSGNFNWSPYQIEGQPTPVPALSNYLFKRDDLSSGMWNTIQTLSASSVLYTDPNYSTYQSTGSWRVETSWSIMCNPTLKLAPGVMAAISKSRSNVQNNIATLGINGISEKDVVMMPNPANDFVTIQLKTTAKNPIIEIYDVVGRKVESEKATGKSDRITMSTSSLSNGIYTVRIICDDGKITKKLVIEK